MLAERTSGHGAASQHGSFETVLTAVEARSSRGFLALSGRGADDKHDMNSCGFNESQIDWNHGREAALKQEQVAPAIEVKAGSPEVRETERKAAWQKPELEKLPLNEARTGHLSGLSDSELFS